MRTRALWALTSMILVGACGGREGDCPEVPASSAAATAAEPAPTTPAPEPASAPNAAGPRVVAGTCDTSWLPDGTKRDLSDEEAASLVSAVREWLANEGFGVSASEAGIVFAKSENEPADDPPPPPEASALAARACGLGASWLTEYLRAQLAVPAGAHDQGAAEDAEGLTCDENVCCYRGMEYVPNGTIVFARDADSEQWRIQAALFVNEALLSEDLVTRNRTFVADALTRLSSASCEREPLLAR